MIEAVKTAKLRQLTRAASAPAKAVFSDAFQFPGSRMEANAVPMIERDRLIMAARPGMIRKLLPLREDKQGVFCGGCYLFDSFENAKSYMDWCAKDFLLDGVVFGDRPVFMETTAQVWNLIGFEDFKDISTQQDVMRFQRWHVMKPCDVEELKKGWPAIRKQAKALDLASVWLLQNPDPHHPQLGLVMSAQRKDPENRGRTASDLSWLESQLSPASDLAASLDGTLVFDRTSWIYMIWGPIKQENDTDPSAVLWPNTPPLPGTAD